MSTSTKAAMHFAFAEQETVQVTNHANVEGWSTASQDFKVGIFDWMDDARIPPSDNFAHRLDVVAFAEKLGFSHYHLAEHHGTPIGIGCAPNPFLAAVAARTHSIRFGPMVTLPAIFHPLRQLEETLVLDHLSRGRYDLGLGRGSVPYEQGFFGVSMADTRGYLDESLEILIQGFTTGKVEHAGKHYTIENYRTPMRPYQRPYPPIWYASANIESAEWIGRSNFNVLVGGPGSMDSHGAFLEKYMEAGRAPFENRFNPGIARPMHGIARHIYVAETDEQARREAGEALKVWSENFNYLSERFGRTLAEFDMNTWMESGFVVVGSPSSVRAQLSRMLTVTGGNFLNGAFIFGNLDTQQVCRSLDLFARQVFPEFFQTTKTPIAA